MRAWYSALFLVALTGAGLASCASSPAGHHPAGGRLPPPNPDAVRAVGLTASQSDEALKLYGAKCMRCHKSYDPRAYTSAQWDTWMSKMSHKAHLDAQQQDLLVRYLQAVRTTTAAENDK